MSCKCSGTMKWIGGLMTGAVFGAAAALLLAPKSGEETRSEIIANIQDKYYEAYDAVLVFGEKVADQIADLKEDFEAFTAKAKKESRTEFDDAFEDEFEDEFEADAEDSAETAEEAEIAEEEPAAASAADEKEEA